MLLTLIIMSWTLSTIFVFLSHPLSFGFVLLIQTIIISITSGILNFDYWFFMHLFLIMIGGMLILFIYMTSIASNEKFKFSYTMFVSLYFYINYFYFSFFSDNFFSMMDMTNDDLLNQSSDNINLSMSKFMNPPSNAVMVMLMIYLLMTLVAIVKITQSNSGPLRQSNF
uniref:NADH-ubiquinone oxidoreductase chain 6 n=1 Tax=Barynotus obscurus TaxID=1069882 RepID=J9PH02_9CUCU|nr:NADH dehydrogenase subunit 6 [Barynotus obscurus]